ncbi:hypothetical protein O181_035068 [Austropuccinia psidii MF-1]|uniref:Uncharacterized protein n=1 Tax=Austropuccinia psidii MF-1 TaxID=1389203 RepID=A0A9Q3H7Y1_9BASI|nr:hypothetical protein [Austropuccinia psidii MF-1]
MLVGDKKTRQYYQKGDCYEGISTITLSKPTRPNRLHRLHRYDSGRLGSLANDRAKMISSVAVIAIHDEFGANPEE